MTGRRRWFLVLSMLASLGLLACSHKVDHILPVAPHPSPTPCPHGGH